MSHLGFGAVPESVGQRCLEGRFCKKAATSMLQCPEGTYNPNKGGESESDCL